MYSAVFLGWPVTTIRLAPLDSSSTWGFVNDKPRRPEEAKFFHQD